MHRKFRVCREFPPRYGFGARSRSNTDAPFSRAEIAAQSAALPPPTTRTSGDLMLLDKVIALPHLHDRADGRQTCSAHCRRMPATLNLAGAWDLDQMIKFPRRARFAEKPVLLASMPFQMMAWPGLATPGRCQGTGLGWWRPQRRNRRRATGRLGPVCKTCRVHFALLARRQS